MIKSLIMLLAVAIFATFVHYIIVCAFSNDNITISKSEYIQIKAKLVENQSNIQNLSDSLKKCNNGK